jgi:hypothetical protein
MSPHRAVPGLVIAVLVAVSLASVAATAVGLRRDPAPQVEREPDPPAVAPARPEVEAAAVLAAWDADRASAWAAGDVRRLRALYAPGSVAGQRDVAMLRRWLDRGLAVTDLQTQVLALREVSRQPDRWVLAVTDRVVGGVASGATTLRLPTDAATTRLITLRLVAGRWLVSAVKQAY